MDEVKLVRIRFTAKGYARGDSTKAARDRGECDGRQPDETFEPGDIVEVSPGSAAHWVKRRVAEYMDGDKPALPERLPPTAKVITKGPAPKRAKAKVS